MKAYTSSSSARAMSVAREALESSTTSPAWSDGVDGSPGLLGSEVMKQLREQIPAEQVGGVRALHVRSRVHDHVPGAGHAGRSEEHTSELQSHLNLVCRLLLENKK